MHFQPFMTLMKIRFRNYVVVVVDGGGGNGVFFFNISDVIDCPKYSEW